MAGRHPIVIRSVQTSRGDIDYCVYDFIKEVEKKPVSKQKSYQNKTLRGTVS